MMPGREGKGTPHGGLPPHHDNQGSQPHGGHQTPKYLNQPPPGLNYNSNQSASNGSLGAVGGILPQEHMGGKLYLPASHHAQGHDSRSQ